MEDLLSRFTKRAPYSANYNIKDLRSLMMIMLLDSYIASLYKFKEKRIQKCRAWGPKRDNSSKSSNTDSFNEQWGT